MSVPLQALESYINTFDLICFKKSSILSEIGISFIGDTHVGICVRGSSLDSKNKYFDKDKIYIYEAVKSGKLGGKSSDMIKSVDGRSFAGVQLRDLKEVISVALERPDEEVAFLPLKVEKKPIKTAVEITELIMKYNYWSYLRMCCSRKNLLRGTLCEQLVQTIYKELGIIKNTDDMIIENDELGLFDPQVTICSMTQPELPITLDSIAPMINSRRSSTVKEIVERVGVNKDKDWIILRGNKYFVCNRGNKSNDILEKLTFEAAKDLEIKTTWYSTFSCWLSSLIIDAENSIVVPIFSNADDTVENLKTKTIEQIFSGTHTLFSGYIHHGEEPAPVEEQ